MRSGLGQKIRELLTSVPRPVAAFPAREVTPPQSAHEFGRNGSYELLPPGLPGSEALIGNILTGISREQAYKNTLLTDLGIPSLRRRRVRTLLLIDDFSGSGKRLIDFGKAIRRHKTIRSWSSYHLITIHVVAFAATNEAARLLRSYFGSDRVHLVRACPTFDSTGWPHDLRYAVETLCHDFAGTRRKMALGFRDSRALIAFEHTAPNNLPYVLWRTGGSWSPLFEQKAVPQDLLPLYLPSSRAGVLLSIGEAGAARLGQLLNVLDRRVRDDGYIAEATNFSYAEVERLVALALELGLIGPTRRLTDAGRAELRRWRTRHPTLELPNNDTLYYPTQLRAGR